MYSDLAYYVSAARPSAKVATYLREHGGLKGMADTLTREVQWANMLAMWEWINTHPLPDDEPTTSDRYQTRQLVIAALVAAQNKLQGGDLEGSQREFREAAARYETHRRNMEGQETPSAFSQWLSGLGLTLASPVAKIALGVGLVAATAILVPMVMRRGR